MSMKRRLLEKVVRQFHHPTGPGGHMAGWVMGRRSSNVRRNRWAVELLDPQPTERVLELGCGPGVALASLAERAPQGLVVGVDHSDVMLGQARRRNAAAVAAGRIRLVHASVEHVVGRVDVTGGPFDAALAVNTVGFWAEPADRLREIRSLLRPGGRIALVSQPRCPGATSATSTAAGDELADALVAAGFDGIRRETLELDPPAVCVLATVPGSAPSSARGSTPMANPEMAEFWNTRGGDQWVKERDRYDVMLEPCGRRLLDAADLRDDERVLDVGCGNGATAVEAARRVGPHGHVVGVDLSAPMLETARRRASEFGVACRFVQGDAQTMRFEGPFDAVISRFGVMFFDDPARAFANLAGALRPGGRVCFVCWQDMTRNEWISVPAMAVVSHVDVAELPDPGAPGPFALADPDRIRGILESAGLTEILLVAASDRLVMGRDPDDVAAFMASNEMGRQLLEGNEPEKVARALDAARCALQPYASPHGVALGAAYWVVSARRPERAAKVASSV